MTARTTKRSIGDLEVEILLAAQITIRGAAAAVLSTVGRAEPKRIQRKPRRLPVTIDQK